MSGQGNNRDMRLVDNREDMPNIEHHHLNKDDTPDMRHMENQQKIDTSGVKDPVDLFNLQTKNDGSADMRFNESKEAVNMGVIDRDETTKGNNTKK